MKNAAELANEYLKWAKEQSKPKEPPQEPKPGVRP